MKIFPLRFCRHACLHFHHAAGSGRLIPALTHCHFHTSLNMKAFFFTALFLFSGLSVFAQLDIPQRSPKASVSYRVGLTDVTVNYSSPAVGKRAIWGYLVPFDKIWRAGANEATNITFGTDVKIGDVTLFRGKYAFFLIPKNGPTWTAVFNSEFDQWGTYKYSEKKDMVRIEVKVDQLVKTVERLKYEIEEVSIEQGALVLEWERKRVTIPFSMETIKMANANIESGLRNAKEEDKWWMYAEAAEFLLMNNGDLEKALNYAEESIKLKPQVWNYWVKAQILGKRGDAKGAVAAADKAKELSAADKEEQAYYMSLESEINKAVAIWKRKK